MNVLFGIITVLFAGLTAFLLNKIPTGRIKKRNQRLALQTVTYIVCFLLAILFIMAGNLKIILDSFVDGRIAYIENKLDTMFPDANILETTIDTAELVSTMNELRGIVETENVEEFDFFETIVLNAFIGKLKNYIDTAGTQADKLAEASDGKGLITVKSILFHIKEQVLDFIAPYFIFAQILIVVILVVYIIVYIGIVLFLAKGGASYNKSIIFGDGAANVERGMDDTRI